MTTHISLDIMEIKEHNHRLEDRLARVTTAFSSCNFEEKIFYRFKWFHFVCNQYIQIKKVDILKLLHEKSNLKQMYTCSLKKIYDTISRTDNLKKWVVKNRLPLCIWIVAPLCSVFILLWLRFSCVYVCAIFIIWLLYLY